MANSLAAHSQAEVDVSGGVARWAMVGVVGAAVLMGTFSSTVVTLVLPQIAATFQVPAIGGAEWVLLSFLLSLAGLQLLAGRLADIFGRKPVLLAGLLLFAIGSAACGLAPSLSLLVAFRVVQGAGSALVLALAVALLADAFPPEELSRAMAWNSILVGIGTGSGPILGGLISQQLGWRWIFLLSVPLAVLVAAVSMRFLPTTKRPLARGQVLDFRGAALLALGLIAVTLWITFGGRWGWTSVQFWVVGALGIVAFVAAARVERQAEQPVLDPALFENRLFVKASISYAASFVCFFAALLLVPLYLANVRGLEPQATGLLITPLVAMIVLAAPLARRLMARLSSATVSACGMICIAAGLSVLSLLTSSTPVWLVPLATFVTGLGMGLFYPANNFVFMASAPRGGRSIASAFLATLRTVGSSVGAAVTTALFAALGGAAAVAQLAATATRAEALLVFQHAFQVSLLAAACVALACAVLLKSPVQAAGTRRRGQ